MEKTQSYEQRVVHSRQFSLQKPKGDRDLLPISTGASFVMDLSQNTALGTGGGNGMLATPVNDTAAATTVDDPKQNLNQVINSIQKTLGLLHQLYLTVSSFNTASQLPLLQRLNGLVTELDNMVKLSEKCNIQVPMEVLNLIDDGKNPDEFTKDAKLTPSRVYASIFWRNLIRLFQMKSNHIGRYVQCLLLKQNGLLKHKAHYPMET
ncbi:MEDIATOR OF RNA polymerase II TRANSCRIPTION SUBUNIT 10 [Salix koriyanagi]|uniref:Mediator of RNA polymerase II transcription subunit 10 n=1 Tax=Salix koriyanagi TaxID=2511006 RepID=A0A9Q0T668_9ROSI|nr:MEDIATOR OF RNA polymerase II TRANSCRIPTION SUBUNIT 10 [Salix koriyanagi]